MDFRDQVFEFVLVVKKKEQSKCSGETRCIAPRNPTQPLALDQISECQID